MISEHVIGRRGRTDAIGSMRKLAPKTPWWLVGAAGVAAAFLIMAFYTEVAGWVFAYIVKAVISLFQGAAGELASTDARAEVRYAPALRLRHVDQSSRGLADGAPLLEQAEARVGRVAAGRLLAGAGVPPRAWASPPAPGWRSRSRRTPTCG